MRQSLLLASTKTYTHAQGLSCCFRQWRADSHCHYLHGYALQISVEFQCEPDEVDKNGWVVDFGSLKPFKAWLEKTFDHRLLVAADDPQIETIKSLTDTGVADVLVLEKVGMEAFGILIMKKSQEWLGELLEEERKRYEKPKQRVVWVHKVMVNEHETNGVVVYAERYGVKQ